MLTDPKKTKDEIVRWIRDYFERNGDGCVAVIGISGGKDSSIVAALCVEALGKERVLGILMPNGEQPDIDDAKRLVGFLGIESIVINIHSAVLAVKREVKTALDDHWSRQSSVNLPARLRMATLYAVSQTVKGRVANTCNRSEDYVGYSTKFGDSAGDFSPLSNLLVSEVKQIGYELGLPAELVDKTPSDGLCGATDEENLGFSYDQLDNYILFGSSGSEETDCVIASMHERNLHKLLPMPSFRLEE